ncbi:hypothetical protein CNQ87_10945 [Lysinibacillus fusiformis]|uniref:helix-turn-helix domain-containing protein n=1 Tax=Lysinibacillus fusiformis TaxID=28031 RepID=UPI0000F3A848|nr:helix-turn-helix domain-containing protein [Lysinibacillus fusiformis]EAZ84198.1 hypothetical protein BB14905_15455 [Bacillus sp. B14905]PCD84843.1 hypothetical protein CNQ87_10945 [Lysinibacillus fusiformis]
MKFENYENSDKLLRNACNQKSNNPQSYDRFSCVNRGRKPISDEKIELIKKLHLEGLSIRSIASIVKVGLGTVQKYQK